MKQPSLYCSLVIIFLFTDPVLFGQAFSSSPESFGIRVVAKHPAVTNADKVVTAQQIHHVIPAKARKELEKAEKNRYESRIEEAIRQMNRAISIDPEFVSARNNLAVVYMAAGQPERAIAQLEKAITIDPKQPALFANLALSYGMIEKLEDAERSARSFLALNRTDGHGSMLLGLILVKEKKFTEEALHCFERARDEFPLAHLLAGRVFIAQGKTQLARTEIQTYLSSDELENRGLAHAWMDFLDRNQPALNGQSVPPTIPIP